MALRYQFSRPYAYIVAATVDDWIILRRIRAAGIKLAYFGVAEVVAFEPNLVVSSLAYARVTNYLAFDAEVPDVERQLCRRAGNLLYLLNGSWH